jgi:hypothetical protein
MLQNPHFTALNPHMTSHQFNKIAKNKNKLTHTMRNTQRKENPQTHAGNGSGTTPAVGLARPDFEPAKISLKTRF